MKIEKALIIRRLQTRTSMIYAEGCVKSCDEHNLPYEFIDAVEFLSPKAAFESVGARMIEGYKNTMGNCCCHASHIECWARIIELDHPCIILEHDALIKGDVTILDLPDMAVVTFGHRVKGEFDYTPPSPAKKLVSIPRAFGAHAYGLTPKTAQHLHNNAVNRGVGCDLDNWLMRLRRSGLPLFVCDPPQAVAWVRIPTTNFIPEEATEEPENIPPFHIYEAAYDSYPEALTPSWYEGLR